MILLCGIPSELPIAMVREEIVKLGLPYVMFNQRMFDDMDMSFKIDKGHVTGKLRVGQVVYDLEDFKGVYSRLMDYQLLPELKSEPTDSARRKFCRALHDTLLQWCEVTPCCVINRANAMGSNFSKPYQMQLIREQGFAVPETIITNDPNTVRRFLQIHKRVIYKSISSVRSIVKVLEEKDLHRLDLIRWCPVLFQEFIDGTNIRVHTIGTKLFATAVTSNTTDYRYPQLAEGGTTELSAFDLPDMLAKKCIRLSRALGLGFAGIDLKITPQGHVYCFEVNPSPGFSYYELSTCQPIAKTLAQFLAGINVPAETA